MKLFSLLIILSQSLLLLGQVELNFDRYFTDQTMRIDYYHTGDSDDEIITLDHIYCQGTWAGSLVNLLDPFPLGSYRIKIYNSESGDLLYTRGFDSIFGEYQATDPAQEGIKRTYHESILIPYPKNLITAKIEKRGKNLKWQLIFESEIDPSDYHIIDENVVRKDRIIKIQYNGNPHEKVDLVFLGDGYERGELWKFRRQAREYADVLMSIEPFSKYQKEFNIWGIFSPSLESGTDEPRQESYSNTVFNSSFNTFDLTRYLFIADNKMVRDIASQVPYDAICIMVNHDRYGGGGVYNLYVVFTANNGPWNQHVFVHEFGHSFASLGDEYYSAEVAYNNFFPQGVEPDIPNLTALLDPENIKWKEYLTPGIALPTEWGKVEFDSLNRRISELYHAQEDSLQIFSEMESSKEIIESTQLYFSQQISLTSKVLMDFVANHPMKGMVGAFEGGGYTSKEIYRPTVNSLMHKFTETDWEFYPVNEAAIERMILYYISDISK